MSDHTVATSVIPVQTEESRKDWLKDIFRRWYLAVKPGHGSPHVEHPPLKDWVNFLQRNPMTAEVAEDFAKTVYDEDKEMLKIEIEKRRLAMAASNHPDPRPEPQRQTAATQAPSSIYAPPTPALSDLGLLSPQQDGTPLANPQSPGGPGNQGTDIGAPSNAPSSPRPSSHRTVPPPPTPRSSCKSIQPAWSSREFPHFVDHSPQITGARSIYTPAQAAQPIYAPAQPIYATLTPGMSGILVLSSPHTGRAAQSSNLLPPTPFFSAGFAGSPANFPTHGASIHASQIPTWTSTSLRSPPPYTALSAGSPANLPAGMYAESTSSTRPEHNNTNSGSLQDHPTVTTGLQGGGSTRPVTFEPYRHYNLSTPPLDGKQIMHTRQKDAKDKQAETARNGRPVHNEWPPPAKKGRPVRNEWPLQD